MPRISPSSASLCQEGRKRRKGGSELQADWIRGHWYLRYRVESGKGGDVGDEIVELACEEELCACISRSVGI